MSRPARLLSTLAAGAAALGLLPPVTPAEDPGIGQPRGLIVQFRTADISSAEAQRAVGVAGGLSARRSAFGGRYLVELPAGASTDEAAARFRRMAEVEFVEPNGWAHTMLDPNDELYRLQWNLRLIHAPRTWDIQKGDPSVVVAVVDTGVAYEDFGVFRKAPDWGGTVFVTGFNAITGGSHANDDNGHGTHVASTIAEATDNRVGMAGIAYRCALMPVKVLDSRGSGTFFDIAEGIDYATDNKAKVINLSLGADITSQVITQAIDRAVGAGIVVVAAAGNDGRGTVSFPASLPNVIAVGAIDSRKQRAPYSNYGTALDLVAPGGDLSRDDDNDGFADGVFQQTLNRNALLAGRYDEFSYRAAMGTSQAAPHVAAVAALLIQQGITDPKAVQAAIQSTAEDLGAAGRDDTYGFGLVRPDLALKGLGFNK